MVNELDAVRRPSRVAEPDEGISAEELGLARPPVDVVFTGADYGIERGVEQDYQRSLSVSDPALVLLPVSSSGVRSRRWGR